MSISEAPHIFSGTKIRHPVVCQQELAQRILHEQMRIQNDHLVLVKEENELTVFIVLQIQVQMILLL